MAKLVYQTGKPPVRTDYLEPYQYEGDSLRFFSTPKGGCFASSMLSVARNRQH